MCLITLISGYKSIFNLNLFEVILHLQTLQQNPVAPAEMLAVRTNFTFALLECLVMRSLVQCVCICVF